MIVRMKHLDLVCIAADKEATLERLRNLGAVHLDLSAAVGMAVPLQAVSRDGFHALPHFPRTSLLPEDLKLRNSSIFVFAHINSPV